MENSQNAQKEHRAPHLPTTQIQQLATQGQLMYTLAHILRTPTGVF